MTARKVVPIRRPSAADAIGAALDRLEPIAAERVEVALHLAYARHIAAVAAGVELGPSPSVAAVYAQRELRLALTDLERLVAEPEPINEPDPADDPELAFLVEAIRSASGERYAANTSTTDASSG